MLDRRTFLKRLAPAAAGVILAPTLAETLYHGAKKYFFLNGNPLEEPSLLGLRYCHYNSTNSVWSGFSRTETPVEVIELEEITMKIADLISHGKFDSLFRTGVKIG